MGTSMDSSSATQRRALAPDDIVNPPYPMAPINLRQVLPRGAVPRRSSISAAAARARAVVRPGDVRVIGTEDDEAGLGLVRDVRGARRRGVYLSELTRLDGSQTADDLEVDLVASVVEEPLGAVAGDSGEGRLLHAEPVPPLHRRTDMWRGRQSRERIAVRGDRLGWQHAAESDAGRVDPAVAEG